MNLKNKRILFYIILFVMIFSILFFLYSLIFSPKTQALINVQVWDGNVSQNFTSGSGAYNDPYIISNGGDLAYLFQELNGENYLSYYNGYYEISNNIDLNGYDFSYLNSDNPFKGHINGNGYTIFNFKLEKIYQKDDNYYISLFNELDSAFITYLNIENVSIKILENENFNENSQINISLLSQSMTNTDLKNISFHNIKVDGIDISNLNGGLISLSDKGNNKINNININLNSKYPVNQIFKKYKDYDINNNEIEETIIKNILYSNNENNLIDDIELENTYHYNINDEEISFEEKDNQEIINILNDNEDNILYWTIEDKKIVVKCILLDEVEIPEEEEIEEEVIPFTILSESYDFENLELGIPRLMLVGTPSFTEEESGIRNNIVYVNDLDKDKNYYKSLNYTEVRSGSLPGEINTGYYNEEYLVKARVTYSSEDINNNLTGTVSPIENANTFVYYKYFPLERDLNGNLLTDSNNNNYIRIELIDGPFSARPNDKGFNGWSTNDDRVTLEFDKDTYTRYALVSVGEDRVIDLTFNAIWENANIQTGGSSNISDFDNYGMKKATKTIQVTENTQEQYDCNFRFSQNITTIDSDYSGRTSNGNTLPSNVYYTRNNSGNVNSGTTLYYSGDGTTCRATGTGSGTKRCYYFTPSQISSGTAYNSSTTYRIIIPSGSNYTITEDASTFTTHDTCTRDVTNTYNREVSLLESGFSSVGYFYYVGTSYISNNLYYDASGIKCSVNGNTCSSGAYKLIQYNDSLNNTDGTSISVINEVDDNAVDYNNYYYLVTRDMNILVNTSSGTNLLSYMSTKPYTLTSTYNGNSITNNYVTFSSNATTVSLSNDMVIENIRVLGYGGTGVDENSSSTGSLGANTHNLKVGRNVNYTTSGGTVSNVNKVFNGIYGLGTSYSGSSSNPQRFKVIVESGSYNYLLCGEASGVGNTGSDFYLNTSFIYGSDYDRVNNDNSKLLVAFNALSTIKDDFVSTSANKYLPASTIIVKSGRYGKDSSNNYYNNNARGIYVGGRTTNHSANALRVLKLEGGDVNVINGGPCVENNLTTNSTAFYMTGGTVRQVFGGAGTTTTYGNRIVSISGGTVMYSVFGGSNAYNSGTEGLLTGSTLVYIGGNAVIGDDNLIQNSTELFNTGSGNVFGAGNGADGGTTAGIVTNSHVIINGGVVKNSVYAGGNHGSVGTNTSGSDTTAVIDLFDGEIKNSVFGAGESVGGGYNITQTEGPSYLENDYYTNVQSVSTVYTQTTVETVRDSTGVTTSGPTTTNNTTNGIVPANVYLSDGSLNNSQFVCDENSVGVVVTGPTTNTSTSRRNNGSYFRPDYYTTTTTTTTTTITCQYSSNKDITGTQYNSNTDYYEIVNNRFVSVTPELNSVRNENNTYRHNVYITLNGSQVDDSIYGGSNAAGNLYGNVDISLIKGSSIGVFGGGKGISSNSSAVQVLGKTYVHSDTDNDNALILTDVYGGSALGKVNKYGNTYVKINGGTITNVYGGGKGDSYTEPKSYGTIKVEILDGAITNVFGGNNLAGIPSETVEVYIKGTTVANSFGGGNSSSVNISNIYLESGGYTANLYGGSNTSGDVEESHVYLNGGSAINIYGGNNLGGTTKDTNIIANSGTVQNIYGGGKSASSVTTNIILNGTNSENVFGGGEQALVSDNTSITLNSGIFTSIYGGSNISGLVNNSNLECNNGTVTTVYGGGKNAPTNFTNVIVNSGFSNSNIYGGGESANINNSTAIRINGGNVTNVYGGSNTSGSVNESNIYYNSGLSTNVYGGNNQGGLVTTSNVNILDGEITNLFGGGNSAGVTTSNIELTKGNITNLYGGSNLLGIVNTSNIKANHYNPQLDIDITINSENINPSIHDNNYATINTITVNVTNNLEFNLDNWQLELLMPSNTVLYSNNSPLNISINNNKANINSINGLNNGASYSFTFTVYSTASINDFIVTSTDNTDYSLLELPDYINVDKLYGGNNQGGNTNSTNIVLENGNYNEIYGGGNEAPTGITDINVDNIKVNSIYGGGNMAAINTNTSLKINDSTITNNIYGGGNAAGVNGNATTIVTGDVNVGKSIFAGGNSGAIGTSTNNNSLAKVVITGATVGEHVYGGCNTSVVYGQTLVNIGYNETNPTDLKQGNINIAGTVFGGGEANASGSEIFDYNFISVTRAIDINIDGLDYIEDGYDFYLNGSIFGSGNASRSEGTSNIYIAHLGTLENPSGNISIQRTDKVVIDNSVLELSGTTDRTNEYSNIKYSLNRIDQLVLKNNSSLLLKENANLLKSFKSSVDEDGEEVLAEVSIDEDTGVVTKNVDNRVYLEAGTILNVTTNESADAYGRVEGMSFLGMYNRFGTNSITYSYGMYDPSFENGSEADAGDIIMGGSYVIGLHATNHDITKDGFYTNYIDEEYTTVSTEYIHPTPEDNTFYMWTIGAASITYSIELTASKYSSLGTGSLSLIDFASGDTEFNVVGFNSDGLTEGISLVDSNSVPRFANTEDEANSIFGISMKTETTEWTGYGVTKLLSTSHGTTSGTRTYKTDSIPASPTFMFYMYHAKNITENQNLGEVTLTLQAKTPKEDNEIEYDVKLVTIKILLESRIFDDEDAYDASITYGKKYDIPSATDVKITNRSQFTAYYSLYATNINNFYGINNEYHRALVSNFVLPVGTTITMLDLASNDANPIYYYYEVDQNEYNRALAESNNNNGEVSYNLSQFIKMDSVSNNNTYNDVVENNNYIRGGTSAYEEFIFIFDFKKTNISGEFLNNSILLTLRNNENRELISVLGIRQNIMNYSLYNQTNAVLEQTTTIDNNYLNYDVDKEINIRTNVRYDETDNRIKIIDTNYESNSMGLNIVFKDAVGTQVDSQLLLGTYFEINNVRYHADSNGVFRIKLSDKVSDLMRHIKLNSSSTLPPGNYTMIVTLFASHDGLHNSNTLISDIKTFNITVINDNNVIKATISDDKMKIVDGNTGKNENNNKNLSFDIKYRSSLTNPNIRVIMYKRSIVDELSTTFEVVNMREYFTNTLSFPAIFGYVGGNNYEYFVINNPNEDNNINYTWKDSLTSGTYKFVFMLYDENFYVDEDFEYVIIEK